MRTASPGSMRRLLRAAWAFQPEDVGVVAVRSAFDFQEDHELHTFFDLPLNTREARRHWADMVGDLIAVVNSGEHPLSQHHLGKGLSNWQTVIDRSTNFKRLLHVPTTTWGTPTCSVTTTYLRLPSDLTPQLKRRQGFADCKDGNP